MRLHHGISLYKSQIKAASIKSFAYFRSTCKILLIVYAVVILFVLLGMLRNNDYLVHENEMRHKESKFFKKMGSNKTQVVDYSRVKEKDDELVLEFGTLDGIVVSREIYRNVARTIDPEADLSMTMKLVEHKFNFTGWDFEKIFHTMHMWEQRLGVILMLNMSIFGGFAMVFAAVYFVVFYVKVSVSLIENLNFLNRYRNAQPYSVLYKLLAG